LIDQKIIDSRALFWTDMLKFHSARSIRLYGKCYYQFEHKVWLLEQEACIIHPKNYRDTKEFDVHYKIDIRHNYTKGNSYEIEKKNVCVHRE